MGKVSHRSAHRDGAGRWPRGSEEVHITSIAMAPPKRTLPRAQGQPAELFRSWQQEGDCNARDALVRRFLPLARSLARRYDRSSEPFDDLLQVASLGLLKAIDRFEPDRGHTFA